MAAPKGNQFWKKRSSYGRKPKFETPDDLYNACVQYFEWVEESPIKEMKIFHSQGEIVRTYVDKARAMTISGLCVFLDIVPITFADYRKRQEYTWVTDWVDEVMRDQKFTGAAAGIFNANIIARDLGLKDESPVQVTVNNNTVVDDKMLKERGIPVPNIDIEDIDENINLEDE